MIYKGRSESKKKSEKKLLNYQTPFGPMCKFYDSSARLKDKTAELLLEEKHMKILILIG